MYSREKNLKQGDCARKNFSSDNQTLTPSHSFNPKDRSKQALDSLKNGFFPPIFTNSWEKFFWSIYLDVQLIVFFSFYS